MTDTHRNKLIGMAISSPIINLWESVRLLFAVVVIVCISSLPRFGARFGLQNLDIARTIPARFKRSTSRLLNDNRGMGGSTS